MRRLTPSAQRELLAAQLKQTERIEQLTTCVELLATKHSRSNGRADSLPGRCSAPEEAELRQSLHTAIERNEQLSARLRTAESEISELCARQRFQQAAAEAAADAAEAAAADAEAGAAKQSLLETALQTAIAERSAALAEAASARQALDALLSERGRSESQTVEPGGAGAPSEETLDPALPEPSLIRRLEAELKAANAALRASRSFEAAWRAEAESAAIRCESAEAEAARLLAGLVGEAADAEDKENRTIESGAGGEGGAEEKAGTPQVQALGDGVALE